jgi:hypothetical protein
MIQRFGAKPNGLGLISAYFSFQVVGVVGEEKFSKIFHFS